MRSKVRAPTQHAIDSRVAEFLQWSGESEFQELPWVQNGGNSPPVAHPSESRPPVREVPDPVARITSQTPSEARGIRDDLAVRSTERLGDGNRPCGVPGCNASTPQRSDRDGQSCACRAPPHRCALLSYPAEIKDQSKIRGYDEGEYTMWQRCGSTFLASQRASPPPGRGLWCFSGPALCARFPRCSISRNRSGRHGLERTPSPAPEFQKVRWRAMS